MRYGRLNPKAGDAAVLDAFRRIGSEAGVDVVGPPLRGWFGTKSAGLPARPAQATCAL